MRYQGYKKYLSRVICLLLLGLISACTDVVCIEPDDFGYGHANIPSNPGNSMIHSPQIPGSKFIPEYADWTDTGYITDGSTPIVLVVDNNWNNVSNSDNHHNPNLGRCNGAILSSDYSWTAWFGQFQSGGFIFPQCTAQSDWCKLSSPPNSTSISNIPCTFTQGVGGYALLVPVDANGASNPSPNATNGQISQAWSIYHLGATAPGGQASICAGNDNSTLYDASCQAGGLYLPNSPPNCVPSSGNTNIVGCKLYVKMLDQLYEDNYGNYALSVKSGFETSPGVLSGLVSLVTSTLNDSTAKIYQALIPYLGYIRIILILYIVFVGIGFLIGNVEITQRDFIVRILKVGLVIQIATTDTSWSFFNGYFFQFFTEGVGEITGMLFSGGNESGFAKLDRIVNEFLSPQTLRKVTALLFTSISGFLFFFMFYFVAMIAIYAAIRAVIMYIICYTIISVLIIIAPIFIPFILFKQTKHFFDEWLKYLISFFIQPIVILAFAFFVCEFVLNQMYYILGIRVCWTYITTIFAGWDLYLWKPAPIASNPDGTIPLNCISAPGRICGNPSNTSSNGCGASSDPSTSNIYNCDSPNDMCAPYECNAMRNSDTPYLDPNYANDLSKWQELISGVYIDFIDVAIFAVLGWLMLKLIDVIPEVAKSLAGTPRMMTNIAEAGSAVIGNAWVASKNVANYGATQLARAGNFGVAAFTARQGGAIAALRSGVSAAYDTKEVDIAKSVNKRMTSFKERFQDSIGDKIEKARDHPKVKFAADLVKSVTKDAGLNTLKLAARLGVRAAVQVPKVVGFIPRALTLNQNKKARDFSKAAGNLSKRADDAATYFMGKWTPLPGGGKPVGFIDDLRNAASKRKFKWGAPVLSGLMNSLADTLDGQENVDNEKRQNILENYQDKIGGLLDNFFESKFAKYGHAVHSLTGGAFGTDANEQIEGTGNMSRADYIRAQHEKNLDNWQGGLMGNPNNYQWGATRALAKAVNAPSNYLLAQADNQSLTEVPFLNRATQSLGLNTMDQDHPVNKGRN